jgi:hypothetical protein
MAFGLLIGFLEYRDALHPDLGTLMLRAHDVGVILQFLFFIPVAFGLHMLSQKRSPGMSRATLYTGIGALSITVLFLLLIFPKLLADPQYMIPQGVFGVWLMIVCWRLQGILSKGVRWFAILVGLGLALTGTFPLALTIFIDKDAGSFNSQANMILHMVLWIGSPGVAYLPILILLLGRRLLREKI